MFNKVLVSEDMQDINKGVYTTLCELGINEIHQVQYCDDAYLKIKKGELDGEPFQLIISDLSFKSDHREQKFSSGESLIKALKMEYPSLKIIVYSIEDRLQKVRALISDYNIDGYVCKSRKGLIHLTKAIESVQKDTLYLSPEVSQALSKKNNVEIDDFDILLLKQLSKGLSQEEISSFLKQKQMSPSSLSSIEKRLNKLRIDFKANNAIHLVATAKDLGLI
ncbi:response regulator transcription factor [Yeosuana marina]|uniref:response regulator transcription factor n=1 Tax=Yeosuana marina TaxID=1565536 RepID=UPI00141EAFD6|nr:response regulator transcription factor [Yeosuana marina]